MRWSTLLLLLTVTAVAAADPQDIAGGHPRHGAALIARSGCGFCHTIPGIADAEGHVGPPLNNIADRTIIAGVLANTPEDMIRWLQAPQSVVPGNAMPDMGLSEQDARDIAAYLYTLH
ncbi:MAG: c-type cytochrome [Pseudomonadota bacterium]|nr:c-type cytochrome [Pseudomonadota bacterium]